MSRIGNTPIIIPINVFVSYNGTQSIQFQGLLGIINKKYYGNIKMKIIKNKIYLKRCTNTKVDKSLHGLYNILLKNMIIGVSKGFTKKLQLRGVGYRASLNGQYLFLSLGYSHNILIEIPKEVMGNYQYVKGKSTVLILKSLDKQLLGIVSSKIRSFRKPEPYKGKGIKYVDEYIIRKSGKSA